MIDPLQQLLQVQGLAARAFPVDSRYHGLTTLTIEEPDGTKRVYVSRRFIPPADRFALLQTHSVVGGDRLDKLAARYLGNPELFWQLCDANGAMRPNELVETVGRRLRITLPVDIPGAPDVEGS
jgi:hypothetical protein